MTKVNLSGTHRRALSINLRYVYRLLQHLREAKQEEPREDLLAVYSDLIPQAVHEELEHLADQIDGVLVEMVQELDLPKSEESIRRAVIGEVAVCWESVLDCDARALRGYGTVPDDAARYLDQRIKVLSTLLWKTEEALEKVSFENRLTSSAPLASNGEVVTSDEK